MDICPYVKNEKDVISLALSEFYSPEDSEMIIESLLKQKGGGCSNEFYRWQSRFLIIIIFGTIVSIIMTTKWVFSGKKREEVKVDPDNVMDLSWGQKDYDHGTGSVTEDRMITAYYMGEVGLVSLSGSLITCLADKVPKIIYNATQHMPELKLKIQEFITHLYETTGGGFLWNLTLGGLIEGFKNYITNGSASEIDIIFRGIEDVVCDFLEVISSKTGGYRKSRKCRKIRKSRKSRKYKKSRKNRK